LPRSCARSGPHRQSRALRPRWHRLWVARARFPHWSGSAAPFRTPPSRLRTKALGR